MTTITRRRYTVVDPDDYVREPRLSDAWDALVVDNLFGTPWYDAKVPPQRHSCWAQTRGLRGFADPIFRCACGAIAIGRSGWAEKNARRKEAAL